MKSECLSKLNYDVIVWTYDHTFADQPSWFKKSVRTHLIANDLVNDRTDGAKLNEIV